MSAAAAPPLPPSPKVAVKAEGREGEKKKIKSGVVVLVYSFGDEPVRPEPDSAPSDDTPIFAGQTIFKGCYTWLLCYDISVCCRRHMWHRSAEHRYVRSLSECVNTNRSCGSNAAQAIIMCTCGWNLRCQSFLGNVAPPVVWGYCMWPHVCILSVLPVCLKSHTFLFQPEI